MTPTTEASTSDFSPPPSGYGSDTPQFVSAHGSEQVDHVKVDMSLDGTHHTATAHTSSAVESSIPKQPPQPRSQAAEKHNRTTIKRNNVAPEPPKAHHDRNASTDSGGILLNASTKPLHGSMRGDGRTSLTFGNLPRSIEVRDEDI